MILQHYIKIAFRNLAKYKVQSAISIVGLAIGLICFTYGWNWYRYETNYDGFYPQSGQIYRINKRERNRRNYRLFWHAN